MLLFSGPRKQLKSANNTYSLFDITKDYILSTENMLYAIHTYIMENIHTYCACLSEDGHDFCVAHRPCVCLCIAVTTQRHVLSVLKIAKPVAISFLKRGGV